MLGVQVASALRDLYGRNGAETISGLCGTRVVLAAPDRDTAQWSADSLGRSEVEEIAEGYSYGANTIRDGVSLTPRRELRALALPSEIMRLENLEGYLKFPGPWPVASIRLRYVKRLAAAARFVPREEGAELPARPEEAADDREAPVDVLAEDKESGTPDSAFRQGEPDLPPLPEETDIAPSRRDGVADAAAGDGTGPRKAGSEPDAPATAAGDRRNGEPDAGPGPAAKPSAGREEPAARPDWV